jgi:menaquinol-cytochrome c reductase iron-sulfur subunit
MREEQMNRRANDSGNPLRKGSSTSEPVSENRRSFLGTLLTLGSVCVGTLLSVPLIRFTLFPLLRRTTELSESTVGSLTEFTSLSEPALRTIQIEQVDGWRKTISEKVVYVTKDDRGEMCVLSSICPHLGCTVPWVAEKNEFVCPCHGATYSSNGKRRGGPSLRGMDTLESTVQGGKLMVRFQYFRQLVADKEIIG